VKVGQKIFVRSPVFCQTPDMKICKKCWGEKKLETKYIGILAGQILAERFTQLSLRSFHDSGSAVLDVDDVLVTFIKDHLKNIRTNKDEIVVIFDTETIPIEFMDLSNYKHTSANKVHFNNIKVPKQNKDPVEGLKKIRTIISASKKIIHTPSGYYQELMGPILEVGSPYSSFVECLFANMFLCKNDDIWRYNQNEPIIKKLGDKTLASRISPLLNLLYQQNQKTIESIDFLDNYTKDDSKLTIYEKLFLERF